ncbi:MAG: hypothetical protein ACLS7X_09380 [Mediterraneibacter gnavus]
MNTRINKQQWQEEEALRRFQLISPLLQADLDDAKRIQSAQKDCRGESYIGPFPLPL